ncbi:MAG: DUF721 domain-containing protein [Sedimentisphaerales bacterium]|nr:DUF721 domain-containing protein [Sedimentisphaerales bacterium]
MAFTETDERFFRSATSWQTRPGPLATPLGQTVRQYLQERNGVFQKNKSIVDLWNEIVPPEMRCHCTVKKIEAGTLTVEVDPGAYMHEMRLMSDELLRYLGSRSGRSGIRRIVLRPRPAPTEEYAEEQE